MSLEYTVEGIEVDTFNEIFLKKQEEYKDIYGQDIDLDQNTPDGQRIGIEADILLDLQSFAGYMYTQIDPDFAEGENLNVLAKIAGITRKPATQSNCEVTITTDKLVTIPLGWEVIDENKNIWKTRRQYQLPSVGDNKITLYAEDFGAISAGENTLINQTVVLEGVVSVTNELAANVGIDEETDEVLRIRRNLSTENAANSTIGSLTASLLALEGVKEAVVYENNTNNPLKDDLRPTDKVGDDERFPAHSIWVIIDGGDEAEISKTIVTSKTAGCDERGEKHSYHETIQGGRVIAHTPAFDRPTLVNVSVELKVVSPTDGVTIDDAIISKALQSVTFGIGQDINITSLYRNIYSSYPKEIIASEIMITRGGTSNGAQAKVVESKDNEILVIDTVVVNPEPPTGASK